MEGRSIKVACLIAFAHKGRALAYKIATAASRTKRLMVSTAPDMIGDRYRVERTSNV